MCVLLGGPGGGKSTLLRAHLADSADRWLGGRTGATIPVMVRAAALTDTDPLPTALAKAVTGDLRQVGLLDELGTDFFRHPPDAGVSWLVLVDGLDEIPDTDTRSAVLTMLAGAASAGAGVYRFVVATRPLPATDLGPLGQHVPRYELQPFSPDDLLTYATHWFRSLDDPSRHADAFVTGLRRSRLEVLARTPLMAFMLCQLYATDPARPLPDGRTGAYQSFVELIYEQNVHKNIKNTHDEAIRRLKDRHQIPRDNQAAEQAAQRARDHLPELIDHLAYKKINKKTAPAVEILASHLGVQRPGKVIEPLWNAFLGDLLRPTGLLVERAGDFEFLHQTLLEYHAARHATRDDQARIRLHHMLFPIRHPAKFSRKDDAAPALRLERSYLGFLLDGLFAPQDHITADAMEALEHIARHDSKCLYFARLVKDFAVAVPPHVLAPPLTALAANLDRGNGANRMAAAELLVGIEGHRREGIRLLTAIANDPDPFRHGRSICVEAAQLLASLDGCEEDGARVLAGIAADLTRPLDDHLRTEAAGALAELGDAYLEEAARLLRTIATDRPTGWFRAHAAWLLAGLEGHLEEGANLLVAAATVPTGDHSGQLDAAEVLATLDGYTEDAARSLTALASDPTCWYWDRFQAAKALAEVDGHEEDSAALFKGFTTDPALYVNQRLEAARLLGELPGHRAEAHRILRSTASDKTQPKSVRERAVMELRGGPRNVPPHMGTCFPPPAC
ncbi:hypothetical protein AB0K57_32790 [Streptomyces halstedii]|uniref:NACHT domain-containing protein n=1 Tax=Streptomyces halstedii TaxID=1944 RepID=UPI003460D1E3